jgi:hypothetical protein
MIVGRWGGGTEIKQLRGSYAQPFGDQTDIFQADVSLSPFNTAHVAAIETDQVRESFLAPAPLAT